MLTSASMLRPRFTCLLWVGFISYSLCCPFFAVAVLSNEPLNIAVTIPVLKDFVEQVGGARVHVTSLLSGYDNEHTYAPKLSDLVTVRNAQVLFEVGIGLEVWVSSLVKSAGSPSLQVITTAKGIALLRDTSEQEGASLVGDASGNPHVWMDPENVVIMVRHITETLIQVDPSHATEYRANQASYVQKLDHLRMNLSKRIARVVDRRFIAHHPAWPYFARRFGFQIIGTIQPQSGSEPSALQLHKLIAIIKKDQIKVIVSEVQLSQRIPELLAKETGARVLVLTTLPGGLPYTGTYLDLLRYNVLQLVNALDPV